MSLPRKLDLVSRTASKSCFLFGPRGVGKTTLINNSLPQKTLKIDLLKSRYFTDLSANPSLLEELCGNEPFVVIDEIQRIPELLNEVHRLIEEKKKRFLLTGSSARKLKRGHANLLGGRARPLYLYPFIMNEIGPSFELHKALLTGTLPAVWFSDDPAADLDAYLSVYLKEEIKAEGIVRNLPAFMHFLKVSALCSGELVNYAAIASDSAVGEGTVRSHFQILEDTLLGTALEPFIGSKKRKAIGTHKFYLFDNGVRNFILGIDSLDRYSNQYGICFETFMANELKAYLSYKGIHKEITFWRTTSQFEVDFLIGRTTAIEVKATQRVSSKHLKGLGALAEEKIFKNFFLISEDSVQRVIKDPNGHDIQLLPWNIFLDKIWKNEIEL
jgi:predicted AAA+ superfamily ATPase